MRQTTRGRLTTRKAKTKKQQSLFAWLRRLTAMQSAALVMVLFAAIGSVYFVVTHAETGAAADAAPLVRPNIVLVLTDDQTIESLSKMQYMSSQTDWIRFDKGFANNGLCCPSRAAVLSGQYDTHNNVTTNANAKLLNEKETLAVWLQRAGYQNGMFGKYLNRYPFGRGLYKPAGWADWQVPYHYQNKGIYGQYDYRLNNNGKAEIYGTTAAHYQVNVLTNKAIRFIKAKASAKQPFFAMFTPTATHGPWKASPTRINTMKTEPLLAKPNFNVVAADQPAYLKTQPMFDKASMDAKRRKEFEAARSVDDALKRIDNTLKSSGVYDNTVVIYLSDNAYSFGSHRWERKRCEYNECAQTPILVRYPGLAGRTDTTTLVSNIDIAATVSQIAGATPAIQQDGRSLVPLLFNEPIAWRDSLLLHWPGGDMDGNAGRPESMPQFWGVVTNLSDGKLWKYVEIDTGEKELYDQAADPYEMNNLANEAPYAVIQAEIKAKLDSLKSQALGSSVTTLRTDMPNGQAAGIDVD